MGSDIKLHDLHKLASAVSDAYINTIVSQVNNQIVRMAVMTSAYQWHYHPNSDETFIGVEGLVIIETDDSVFELHPGNIVTIPKKVLHRTSPQGSRSVNLTIESADMKTAWGDYNNNK